MSEGAELLKQDLRPDASKLRFPVSQELARTRGVLVASYYWRKPYLDALQQFAEDNDCQLLSIETLVSEGDLTIETGHGSPGAGFKGRGTIPYVKVVDIKNWKIIENPKYFIPEAEANRVRRNRYLQPFDVVTPTRASRNIGLPAIVMPWQTSAVLTREIHILRVTESSQRLTPWLLLVLLSLRVVNDQFRYLVLMQMNREDLGDRMHELLVPVPRSTKTREAWQGHVREYYQAQERARKEYEKLWESVDGSDFVDGP